jgi:hypothetical protein
VAGVTGSFSPDPASISLAGSTVDVIFTPTSVGTASITCTNNRSLDNPVPLVITVTAATTQPTLYTQEASADGITLGGSVGVVYTLDQPAFEPVTIIPACTLAGSFVSGSSVVIGTGETTGVATFVPSIVGTATFSATNNRSLANPSTVNVLVTRINKGQLLKLGINRATVSPPPVVTPVTASSFTVGVNTSGVSTTTFGYTASGLTPGRPLLVFIWGMSTTDGLSRFFSSFTTSAGSAELISGHTGTGTSRPFGIYAVTGHGSASVDLSSVFNGTMQSCYMGHVELIDTAQTTYSSRTAAVPNTAGATQTATSTPGIVVPANGIAFGMAVSVNSALGLTFSADAGSAVEVVDVFLDGGVSDNKVGLCTFDDASATTFSVSTSPTSSSKWTTAFSWAP